MEPKISDGDIHRHSHGHTRKRNHEILFEDGQTSIGKNIL